MEPINIAIIVAVYFIAAFYSSLAGGASLLTIPTLIFAGLSPHTALGTNKIGTFGLSAGASLGYGMEDKIDYKFSTIFMIFLVIGSAVGSYTVLSLPEQAIKKAIGVVMIVIASFLFFNKDFGTKTMKRTKRNILIFVLFSIASGFYSGFYGAGAGTINRFMLSAFFAYTMINSAAISTFANMASNIFALAVFTYYGAVQYSLFVPIILASFTGAFFGSKYAIKIGNVNIKRLLLIVSVIMAVKLLFF